MIHVPVDIFAKRDSHFTVMRSWFPISVKLRPIMEQEARSDDVVSWALRRTMKLGKLLSLKPEKDTVTPMARGFAEHNNVLLLVTCNVTAFSWSSLSLCSSRDSETNFMAIYHPFESVYTAAKRGSHARFAERRGSLSSGAASFLVLGHTAGIWDGHTA